MKEKQSTPDLRFPEFSGEWTRTRLEKAKLKIIDGDRGVQYPNADDLLDTGYCLFLNAKNVTRDGFVFTKTTFISKEKDEKLRKGKLKRNDIVLTTRGTVGNVAYFDEAVPFEHIRINSGMVLIRNESNRIDSRFLCTYFSSPTFRKELSTTSFGSAQLALTVREISKFKIVLPLVGEQRKIAAFLWAVNDKIAQLAKKKELLLEYKKGVMRQIFDQKIRFKDDHGNDFPDWEPKELKEFASRVKKKNTTNEINFVLTNSATKGVISQSDYFDKDVANANNLTSYYVVDKDEFVYNPRISTSAPVGPIKRNNLRKGVMSPLYMVFRLKDVNLDFFEFFFETNTWHDYMRSIANFGARHDRMNITTESFFEMPILVPSLAEQEKIAKFLRTLDERTQLADLQLEETKNFKDGLLQQMFV